METPTSYGLPDYLWGIETYFSESQLYLFCRLPDYLWGIETSPEKSNFHIIPLPDYLWGIETPCYQRKRWMPVRLPDYLWGIETYALIESVRKESASRLPMRNWNTYAESLWVQGGRFQTTYEELKPWGVRLSVLLIASRLPMRNWNPLDFPSLFLSTASRLPMRNWNAPEISCFSASSCFQTTYEELKRLSFSFDNCLCQLPDYLWGIETLNNRSRYEIFYGASRLPMRNWNSHRLKGRDLSRSRFQTTYEELKLWMSSGTAS